MAWGMYKKSHPPRQITALKREVVGINAHGKEQKIYHWQSGSSPYAFDRRFVQPMLYGESEAARQLAEKINRHLDVPIVALRIEGTLYTLTDDGVTEKEQPEILFDSLDRDALERGM